MKIYKIQDTETKLFSNGGGWPGWSKTGKSWKGMGPLKNHLHQVVQHVYKNAIVVELEYVETCITETPVAELLAVMDKAKLVKKQKQKQEREDQLKVARLAEFKKLQAEFQPESSK